MTTRNTRFVLKNNPNSSAPFSGATLLAGEPIVNTAAGIMMFSGVTTGSNDWVPAGLGGNGKFFEVGSNLHNLKIRNKITSYSGLTNLSGKFLSGTTSGFILADISSISSVDTYITGFTYNPSTNTLSILQNQGKSPLNQQINSFSGLSISDLNSGRVIYSTGSGRLTTESGFEYSASTNTLKVGNINIQNQSGTTANIGQGGLVIGSGGSLASPGFGDLTVHGNLTVFGTETVVATSELYVEDPQISLNYNPTGSTTVTSVSAGIRIQDGNGIVSGDTYLTIGQMQNLTGLTPTQIPDVSEYSSLVGNTNRGWVTQLNDIVIRNSNKNDGSPNGVRVLAEWDILDGGVY